MSKDTAIVLPVVLHYPLPMMALGIFPRARVNSRWLVVPDNKQVIDSTAATDWQISCKASRDEGEAHGRFTGPRPEQIKRRAN
jgi:hypothetical protein